MDESTQKNTLDEHTQPLQANNQPRQRGASESEFTQPSPRQDAPPKYEYAIPEAEHTVPMSPRVEAPLKPQPLAYAPPPQQYAPAPRRVRKGLSWVWIAVVGLLFGGTIMVGLVLF